MNDDYWGWGREIVGRGLVEQNPFWLLYKHATYKSQKVPRLYSARHLNPTKSNSNGNLTDLVFRFFLTDFH